MLIVFIIRFKGEKDSKFKDYTDNSKFKWPSTTVLFLFH